MTAPQVFDHSEWVLALEDLERAVREEADITPSAGAFVSYFVTGQKRDVLARMVDLELAFGPFVEDRQSVASGLFVHLDSHRFAPHTIRVTVERSLIGHEVEIPATGMTVKWVWDFQGMGV